MSADQRAAGPPVIVNPLSGEQITILATAADDRGGVLEWELLLAPGGRVPSSHAHPEQEECFTVLDGWMRFRVGGGGSRRGRATPCWCRPAPCTTSRTPARGPPGSPCRPGPALSMLQLLETAAAMAQAQHAAARRLPSPVDLALFMRDFEREVRAPYLPAALVRAVIRPAAWLAGRCGLDARYRRLRGARSPGGRARPGAGR